MDKKEQQPASTASCDSKEALEASGLEEDMSNNGEFVKDMKEALKEDTSKGDDCAESVKDKEKLVTTETVLKKDRSGMKPIVKENLELPKGFTGKLAFVLHNVCSKEECDEMISRTEAMGYEVALVNVGMGRQRLMTDVRNSSRVIWDSFEESGILFDRIKEYLPQRFAGRNIVALNERLRILRYHPGEYFKPHFDGSYRRPNGERSYVTIQLYLNEGFKGGSTTFMDTSEKQKIEVVPKTGSVLVFEHDLYHEGSKLKKGVKYTIRTDVMYDSKMTY